MDPEELQRLKDEAKRLVASGALKSRADVDRWMAQHGVVETPTARPGGTLLGGGATPEASREFGGEWEEPVPLNLKTFGRVAGQAILPIGDELTAAFKSVTTGQPFGEALDAEHEELDRIRRTRPGLMGAGEVAGAFVPIAAGAKILSKVPALAKGLKLGKATIGAEALGAATAGAGTGAAWGYLGSDEDAVGRLADVPLPAALGGALGGALGLISRPARGAVAATAPRVPTAGADERGFVSRIFRRPGERTAQQMADERLLGVIDESGIPLEELAARIQPNEMLLDQSRNLLAEGKAVARLPGQGREIVRDRVSARAETPAVIGRARETLDDAGLRASDAADGPALMESVLPTAEQDRLYDLVRRQGAALPKEARAALRDVGRTDGFRAALDAVLKTRRIGRPRDPRLNVASFYDDAGELLTNRLDAKTLLEVRRMIDSFVDDTGGFTGDAARMWANNRSAMARDQWLDLRARLDEGLKSIPNLPEADAMHALRSSGEEAFERARGNSPVDTGFLNERDMQDFRSYITGLEEPAADAYRAGARRNIDARLGAMKPRVRGSLADPFRELFGPEAGLERTRILVGDEAADRVARRAQSEMRMAESGREILGGSDTAENLAQMAAQGDALQTMGAVGDAATGRFRNLFGRATGALGRAATGDVASVRALLGDALSKGGPELEALLARLPEAQRRQIEGELRRRAIFGALGGRVGGTATDL